MCTVWPPLKNLMFSLCIPAIVLVTALGALIPEKFLCFTWLWHSAYRRLLGKPHTYIRKYARNNFFRSVLHYVVFVHHTLLFSMCTLTGHATRIYSRFVYWLLCSHAFCWVSRPRHSSREVYFRIGWYMLYTLVYTQDYNYFTHLNVYIAAHREESKNCLCVHYIICNLAKCLFFGLIVVCYNMFMVTTARTILWANF